MKTFHLIQLGRDIFIFKLPFDNLKCNIVNPAIFENPNDAKKDEDVFAFFGLKIIPLNDGQKIDFRTKKGKYFKKTYPFFSAAFLPEIKKRAEQKSAKYTRPTFAK